MRVALGLLYLATGLLCIAAGVIIAGALLGITTLTYSLTGLVVAALFGIGPALIILAGATMLFENVRRSMVCAATGIIVVFGLALWTVPPAGWRDSIWVFLGPGVAAFLLANLIVLILKRRWVMAAVGSALSSWFFLYGTGTFVYSHLSGNAVPSWTEMWIVLPALLTLASFVSSLVVRTV